MTPPTLEQAIKKIDTLDRKGIGLYLQELNELMKSGKLYPLVMCDIGIYAAKKALSEHGQDSFNN